MIRTTLAALSLLAVFPAIFQSVYAAEIRGIWRTVSPLPTARQEVAFDVLDGRLVVIGGLGGGNVVEVFDPETGAWESLPDLPLSLHHGSAAVVGGRVYSIGGFQSGGSLFASPLAEVFEFDLDRGTWEAREDLPSARGGLFSLALDGQIYTVGGRDDRNSVSALTIYDPVTDSWRPGPDMPIELDHLAAAVLDGKIHVAGGRVTQNGGFAGNDSRLVIFNPETQEWTFGMPLPTARSGHSAVAAAGFLLVMGGEIPGVFGTNEVYDPQNDRWFELDELPTPRHGLAVALLGKEIVTAGGGLIAGIAPSSTAEAFRILDERASLAQFAAGTQFVSRLVLSNPGDEEAQFRFELHSRQNGQPLEVSLDGDAGSVFQSNVEPGGVRVFRTDLRDPTQSGAVTLYSDVPLLSNVLFSGPPGFAGVAGVRPGRRFFVTVLRDPAEETDSGLALADTSGLPNQLTLTLLDQTGQPLAQTERNLQPFGHIAELFDEFWDPGTAEGGFTGSIRIEAQHEIGAVAILLRGNQFAALPVRRIESLDGPG